MEMINSNLIPLTEFCNKFSFKRTTIEVYRSTGRLPKEMFFKDKGSLYVDYKYVEKRLEFRKKMWLQAQDLYYKLMDIFPTQAELARAMAQIDIDNYTDSSHGRVWTTWICRDLFASIDFRGIALAPRVKDYKFVRFARWLLAIHNRIGLKFDTEEK